MKSEQAQFGERLREALKKAQMPESAAELARLVPQYGGTAVTTAAAHRWIRGQSIPRAENIRALATLLRVPLDWLYGVGSGRRVKEPKGEWQASAIDSHAVDAFFALDERRRKLVRELIALLGEGGKR
jgi:transcriptional regulator with XRE-family HTH domain